MSVAGKTALDERVIEYLRVHLGAGDLKQYQIHAYLGEVHVLRITYIVPGARTLEVLARLLPFVRDFSCSIVRSSPDYDVAIDADMMININDLEKEE